MGTPSAEKRLEVRERNLLLLRYERFTEGTMVVLSLGWLALLIVELAWGLTEFGRAAGTVIWIIFIGDFLLRLALAPARMLFLRRNVLTVVSLLVPALRVFRAFQALRVLRAARAARSITLVRVLTTANRGMRALGASFRRRGFGYVLALTVAVTFLGAAGMFAFERDQPGGGGIRDFGTALWWTAMLMTTMGSESWPRSAEGRLLCFLLSLYAYSVFGYVTATLATFFIGQDADNAHADVAGQKSIDALHRDIQELRKEIAMLVAKTPSGGTGTTENPEPHQKE